MENIKIFTVVYLILVIVDALMSIIYSTPIITPIIQLIGALFIAISWFYFRAKKKKFLITISSIAFILMMIYGYVFFNTTDFIQGLMMGVSAFLVGSYVIEIVKYYARISKP